MINKEKLFLVLVLLDKTNSILAILGTFIISRAILTNFSQCSGPKFKTYFANDSTFISRLLSYKIVF